MTGDMEPVWRYRERVRGFRKQGNARYSLRRDNSCEQIDTAVQLWQWQKEEGD